jgi:hypothetical protein
MVSGCIGFPRDSALTFRASRVGTARFVRKVSRIFQVILRRRFPSVPDRPLQHLSALESTTYVDIDRAGRDCALTRTAITC